MFFAYYLGFAASNQYLVLSKEYIATNLIKCLISTGDRKEGESHEGDRRGEVSVEHLRWRVG